MLKKLNNNKGFTIIEVMIVLAIAGLIMLIVLLAVPALQRNGRNTSIKSDASAVAGAVSEYRSNNDGSEPTVGSSATGANVTIRGGTAATPAGTAAEAKIQGNTTYAEGTGGGTVTAVLGTVTVQFGAKCPTTAPTVAGVVVTANSRSTAIIYPVEQSSGLVGRCIDA